MLQDCRNLANNDRKLKSSIKRLDIDGFLSPLLQEISVRRYKGNAYDNLGGDKGGREAERPRSVAISSYLALYALKGLIISVFWVS